MFVRKRGFTLVELIVVITIIGILATVIIISYSNVSENVKKSKAKGDIQAFVAASKMLKQDTGEYPGHLNDFCQPTENADGETFPWSGKKEFSVSDNYVGLFSNGISNDITYKNWNGPYMRSITKDPWGNDYMLDPDYYCGSKIEGGVTYQWDVGELEQACDGVNAAGVPTNAHIAVIVSRHNPDEESFPATYGGGNVAALVCKHK